MESLARTQALFSLPVVSFHSAFSATPDVFDF